MLSLRELQCRFAAHLFEDASPSVADWIREDGIDPGARLRIYQNNLHEGFLKTLGLEYPVIRRLVGEDYFRQLGLAFLACHPSRSGDLHHVGAPFPPFLREQFTDTAYLYLADVAALEWAYQECLVAEEAVPLDPQALREVPATAYGRLRFTLRPACRLLRSRFPIVRIWAVNQPEAVADDVVDLDSGPDFVLVSRRRARVYLHRLDAGEFQLLAGFASGASLDEALEACLAVQPQFDLGAALRRCLQFEALAQLTFHQNSL